MTATNVARKLFRVLNTTDDGGSGGILIKGHGEDTWKPPRADGDLSDQRK